MSEEYNILDSEMLPEDGSEQDQELDFEAAVNESLESYGEIKTLKECYTALPFAATIHENLAKLNEMVLSDIGEGEASKIIRSMRQDFGKMMGYIHRRISVERKDQAMSIMKEHWRLHERNISAEQINFMHRIMGFAKADIAKLLGVSIQSVHSRIERYEKNEMPFDGLEIEKLSEDEKVQVVIKKLFLKAAGAGGDREAINAAKIFIELHNRQIERKIVEKWKQIEVMSEFFFSKLIPEIHQKLQEAGANLDIRSVCYELFAATDREVRDVVEKAKMPEVKRGPGRPKGVKNASK